jgi:hypothetical protein
MGSPEFEALLTQAERTQKVLWAAMILAIGVYGVVAWVAVPVGASPGTADTLRPIFWILAAALAAGSLLLHRRFRPRNAPGSTVASDADEPSNPLLRARTEHLAPRERAALAAVARGFGPWIVSLALNEAIAILGLVLSFLAGGPNEMLPLAGLAIALNLSMRPDARRRAEAALGRLGL